MNLIKVNVILWLWKRYVLFCIRAFVSLEQILENSVIFGLLFISYYHLYLVHYLKKKSAIYSFFTSMRFARCSHNFISFVVSILLLRMTVCTTKINLSFLIPCLPRPRTGLTKLVENIDENLPPERGLCSAHNREQCCANIWCVVGAERPRTWSLVN